MEGEVTVMFENTQHRIDLEDLTAADLGELFNLDFEAKFLVERESGKSILLKKREKFRPNLTYTLERPHSSSPGVSRKTSTENKINLDRWASDNHEIIQNCLVLCQAVYEGDSRQYLRCQLRDHNFSSLLRSEHGDCHFLVAEETQSNRLYIAFRGTEDARDITDDLKIYPRAVDSVSGAANGKFHSGFLSRAQEFPLQIILSEERFCKKHLILCGHSLGGAIASIVTSEILIERENRSDEFVCDVTNITFGSPLFGDDAARKYMSEKGYSDHMVHIVVDKDPVPSLLSFAQSVSAVKHQLDQQIRSMVGVVSTIGGSNFAVDMQRNLIEKKDQYMQFLSVLGPFIEPALGMAAVFSPGKAGTAKAVMETVKLVSSSVDSGQPEELRRVYMPIGNFYFLQDDPKHMEAYETKSFNHVVTALDILKNSAWEELLAAHKLDSYRLKCSRNNLYFPNNFPLEHIVCSGYADIENVLTIPRRLEDICQFQPEVESVELYVVTGIEVMILRLVLVGKNLFTICLQDSVFNLGFPFGQAGKAQIKRIPLGKKQEEVVVEQGVPSSQISISDHGATIFIATQFGTCDFVLPKNRIRNVRLQNISQISKHESISVLIRKSVQRGMALAQLKQSGCLHEPLVESILHLAEISISKGDLDKLRELFLNEKKNIDYILSSEEEYGKVSELCDRIQAFVMSPLVIVAEKSLLKKISVGALAVLGGGAFAYLAGPGLLIVGAVEALNVSAVAVAGTMGTVGTGYLANRYLTEALADSNYSKVLKWLTTELYNVFTVRCKKSKPELVQAVSDLRDDDSVYSNERALLDMFEPQLGIDNFAGSGIDKSNADSKNKILQRVQSIRFVHDIRNKLARQCFIGIVGIQDAGKTTLLNQVWGFAGRTGLFAHTEVPTLYQVSEKIHIVDFPGSNSLDNHSKTFSICGAMNNMIIVIIPFTGDVSQLVSNEVARVFEVLKHSESCRVLLCINKCGLYLKNLKRELQEEKNPVAFMKERYVSKLNMHFKDGTKVNQASILFTDWYLDDEGAAFGFEGIDDVKRVIKNYLVELNVVDRNNLEELERAVSVVPQNV